MSTFSPMHVRAHQSTRTRCCLSAARSAPRAQRFEPVQTSVTSRQNRSQQRTSQCTSCSRGYGDDMDRPEPGEPGIRLPSQASTIAKGVGDKPGLAVAERDTSDNDLDYFQELLAIQQNGPKLIGLFGTRNMGYLHQQLVEILAFALCLNGNHIYTSGATGTNAAVIRGALKAEKPELLTVVLPQSRNKQPQESQELLEKVAKVIEMPQNDSLQLLEASKICNAEIISKVQQIICYAFHDSRVLLQTCQEAKASKKMVTLFYLD